MHRAIVHGAAMMVIGVVVALFDFGFVGMVVLSAGVLYAVLPDVGPDGSEPVRRLDYVLGAGAVLLVLMAGIAIS